MYSHPPSPARHSLFVAFAPLIAQLGPQRQPAPPPARPRLHPTFGMAQRHQRLEALFCLLTGQMPDDTTTRDTQAQGGTHQ